MGLVPADWNWFKPIWTEENEKRGPVTSWKAQTTTYSFCIWLHSLTKGSCEHHMKRQALSSKAPAAGLLPLLKGFLWMSLPWCFGSHHLLLLHWGVYYGMTALRIVTLNEIVVRYVRSDPLRGAVEVFVAVAVADRSWRVRAAGAICGDKRWCQVATDSIRGGDSS